MQSSLAFKPSLSTTPSEQIEQSDPFADSGEQSSEEDITLSALSNPKKRQRLYFSSDDEVEELKVEVDTKQSFKKDAEESPSKMSVHSPKSPGTRTRRAAAKQSSPTVDKPMHTVLKESPKKKCDNTPPSNAIQRQRVLKTFKDDDGFFDHRKGVGRMSCGTFCFSTCRKQHNYREGSGEARGELQKVREGSFFWSNETVHAHELFQSMMRIPHDFYVRIKILINITCLTACCL
uniref:Uncharacterized protein n=3 Tax=Schistocephalus solidus TaxID=70667 RepID=A0A0X3PSP4_SCHSO